MICPKCRQDRAHRSHRSGIRDRILHFFHQIPYRCHACNARFYAYRAGEKSSNLRTREEMKIMQLRRRLRWKRSKRELAAYGIATLLLLFIIYYTLQQRVDTGGG
ncbi:MAG: hypothetical protein ABSB15_23950 [Bryobacteraceae bacterium]|jgi:hypothetical protein